MLLTTVKDFSVLVLTVVIDCPGAFYFCGGICSRMVAGTCLDLYGSSCSWVDKSWGIFNFCCKEV